MVSVLITRPQAAAETLAGALQSRGYASVIEPLLTITPLIAPRPAMQAQAVMITSAQALQALESGDHSDLLTLPCFCVGPRSAEKAHGLGFRKVEYSTGDGAELAQLIAGKLPKSSSVLHICGRDIASAARADLEQTGYRITAWPVYRADPVAAFTPKTRIGLEQNKFDAVLVYSPRTAAVLASLLAKDTLEACCRSLIAIGLSVAVTDVLRSLPWRFLIAAPEPSESALIGCLQDRCPVTS